MNPFVKDAIKRGNVARDITPAGGDLVQTESGLVVPREAADARKKRRVWTWDSWKHFKRMMRFFIEEDVRVILQCTHCEKILVPTQVGDGFDLHCPCTIREVRPR